MIKSNKFIRGYLKYIVRSSKCFFIYVGIFIVFFLAITNAVQLENRSEYSGYAYSDEIILKEDALINLNNKKIYVYADKNLKVETFYVVSEKLIDGKVLLCLQNDQNLFRGNVTVEAVTERKSLLNLILEGGR